MNKSWVLLTPFKSQKENRMKTNKEHLIEMLQNETKLSLAGVSDLFDIINEYDWAVFCSQMGDYDHPGERVIARQKMESRLSFYIPDVVSNIQQILRGDGECGKFYRKYFHAMKEKYIGKE